jgi:hypothetical protein
MCRARAVLITSQYCEPDALAAMSGSRQPISSIMRPPLSFGTIRTNRFWSSPCFKRYPPAISRDSGPKRLASHEQRQTKAARNRAEYRFRSKSLLQMPLLSQHEAIARGATLYLRPPTPGQSFDSADDVGSPSIRLHFQKPAAPPSTKCLPGSASRLASERSR